MITMRRVERVRVGRRLTALLALIPAAAMAAPAPAVLSASHPAPPPYPTSTASGARPDGSLPTPTTSSTSGATLLPGPGTGNPAERPAPLLEASPLVQPVGPQPTPQPVMHWSKLDAISLLDAISAIGAEGLIPEDYQPQALRDAIEVGEGDALDQQASRSFDWLVEDLRDGRTPWSARIQWFAVDTDSDSPTLATDKLLARALASHDIAGVLASLDPVYPDYAALKAALATTPEADTATRDAIRINMDRWRWMPLGLGEIYLVANVPEFQVRLMRDQRVVRTYKIIVGKPGRTATPQLAEQVEAVVFNPTWTVPQSIIQHEGLADKLLGNPARARRQGFKVTRNDDGSVTIVQQPGDNNSLGRMKIDMPNPHAIYLHDTPQKYLFDRKVRDFSHGCVRTQKAEELGMVMAMLGAHMTIEQAQHLWSTRKYARIPMERKFPVYITYETMGLDENRQLSAFPDIYNRDDPVVASFAQPRQPHTTQKSSDQEVIVADDPL